MLQIYWGSVSKIIRDLPLNNSKIFLKPLNKIIMSRNLFLNKGERNFFTGEYFNCFLLYMESIALR